MVSRGGQAVICPLFLSVFPRFRYTFLSRMDRVEQSQASRWLEENWQSSDHPIFMVGLKKSILTIRM
jgi:hypothetical protein